MSFAKKMLGEMLIDAGAIKREHLENPVNEQKKLGISR